MHSKELFVGGLGAVGLLWFFVWQLAIHGSPSEHPTITPEEKDYIEESIAKLPQAKVRLIPIYHLAPPSPPQQKNKNIQMKHRHACARYIWMPRQA